MRPPGGGQPVFDTWLAGEHGLSREIGLATYSFSAIPHLVVGTDLIGTVHRRLAVHLRPLLPRVACPTLVIAAEGDRTFDLSHSRALAEGIPGARLEIVPDSGHALVVERPEVLQALVEGFLAEQGRA